MGTLHKAVCTFMIMSRLVLLRIINIPDKICRGNQNTNFIFNKVFPEIRASCEIIYSTARHGTDNMEHCQTGHR